MGERVVQARRFTLVTATGRRVYRRMVHLAKRDGGQRITEDHIHGWAAECWYCRWWFPLHHLTFEHMTNQRDGGTDSLKNLVLACYACNNRRAALESEIYPGTDKHKRRLLEAWYGCRLFYVRIPGVTEPPAPTTWMPGAAAPLVLRSLHVSRKLLKATFIARQAPYRPAHVEPAGFHQLEAALQAAGWQKSVTSSQETAIVDDRQTDLMLEEGTAPG